MAAHYTYLDHILPQLTADQSSIQKGVAALIFGAALVLFGRMLTYKLRTPEGLDMAVVPEKKVTLFGFFDVFIETFMKYHDSVLGKERRKHASFVATIFFFIFLSNILGLIPGMPAITTTVGVNVAMALAVFLYFNIQGAKEQGVWNYIKHFMGPVLLMAPIMFPIEIVSTCVRVLVLNLRLYWNISADHIVLGIFSELLPPFTAFPVYFLGLFISFMQAFIFTTLTMIYILLAVQHEEGH